MAIGLFFCVENAFDQQGRLREIATYIEEMVWQWMPRNVLLLNGANANGAS